ncbi:MAG TPA: MarR family transcriptional regulator [Bryobacteraceae bacterium]|jgi:MarR family 2-MHQ and catechol resistance regulon transcriptional repressor|nr:MarR family transcriptional regulator [Bryobacteraceae bacterium]
MANISGVHLWLILMKSHHSLEKYALHSISGTGLCFSDFAILEILLHKGPLPVNVLGARIALTSGSATTAADRLESRGLVRREADPNDRRARIVHLTPAGKSLIEQLFARHQADMERAVSVLGMDEREDLIRLLKKLGRASETLQSTAGTGTISKSPDTRHGKEIQGSH